MTRLIDANALCEEFKERQRAALRWKEKAILDCDEERQIRADATLAFLTEVKLTIDNAPTVEERPQGEWIDRTALLEELEKEVKMADDWKTAHELFNVVKYFPHYGGAYEI